MANLSQTAANVKLGTSGYRFGDFLAGEAITQGMPVYLSSADSKYYQTDANDGAAKAEAKGIALTPASTGEPFILVSKGLLNLGATLTVGETYVVSTAKGAIFPIGDLGSGHYITILGIAKTAALIDLQIHIGGVQKP